MSDTVYDPEGRRYDSEGVRIGVLDEPVNGSALSSLEDLRAAIEQAEEVAEVEFPDYELYGPGKFIKLVCSTQLSQPDLKKIQLAGLPPDQRRKRMPNMLLMDEGVVFATMISRQCIRIELRQRDDTYRAIDGDFSNPSVLTQLGVMDSVMAVRRVFGNKDAYLIRAGQDLTEACGYGERKPGEPGDDMDPT